MLLKRSSPREGLFSLCPHYTRAHCQLVGMRHKVVCLNYRCICGVRQDADLALIVHRSLRRCARQTSPHTVACGSVYGVTAKSAFPGGQLSKQH